MVKKIDAYRCEVCDRVFTNEKDAEHNQHREHKVVRTCGDPIVRIY